MHTETRPAPPSASLARASLGPLELRLESVEHRIFEYAPRPVLTMPDGLEVGAIERDGEIFLVVDHRRDPARRARIEFWKPTASPETEIAGLYALCDALAN